MPTITNPNVSIDAELLSACDAVLRFYAANTILPEPAIVAPTPGYKAYRKRQALAQKVLNGDIAQEVRSFAILANGNSELSSVRVQAENNGVPIYRFLLSDNPTGENSAKAEARIADWHSGAPGVTIFDSLAGVTNEDLL